MSWPARSPAVRAEIACAGGRHCVEWSGGKLRTEEHDVDAERVLTALGSTMAGCVELVGRWRRHSADERVLRITPRDLGERTTYEEAQWARARAMALRNVDFMRRNNFPVDQYAPAEQKATEDFDLYTVLLLPAALQRRLAATVVANLMDHWQDNALALEAALVGRVLPAVREVAPEARVEALPPHADAELDADRVALPITWLLDVWATDRIIDKGKLVVDAEGRTWRP